MDPADMGTGIHVCFDSHVGSMHCASTWICEDVSMAVTHLVGAERYLLLVRSWYYFQTSILHVHIIDCHQESLMIDRSSVIVCAIDQPAHISRRERLAYVASI